MPTIKTSTKKKKQLSDVHKFRGSHVSYAIKTVGDDPCDAFCVYVGSTSDIEMRMMNHARGRGAKFTQACPPTGEILHIREHDSIREALLAEVALWNLWAGKTGYDRVRGGRWNMPGPMPFPPREWARSDEYGCPIFHETENETA